MLNFLRTLVYHFSSKPLDTMPRLATLLLCVCWALAPPRASSQAAGGETASEAVERYGALARRVRSASLAGTVPPGDLLREAGSVAYAGLNRKENPPEVELAVCGLVHDALLSPDGGLLAWDGETSSAREVVPEELVRPTIQTLYQFFMVARRLEYNTPARRGLAKVVELVESFDLEKELTGGFAPDCFRMQHATLMEKYPDDVKEEAKMLRDFRNDMRELARRPSGSFRLDPAMHENSCKRPLILDHTFFTKRTALTPLSHRLAYSKTIQTSSAPSRRST